MNRLLILGLLLVFAQLKSASSEELPIWGIGCYQWHYPTAWTSGYTTGAENLTTKKCVIVYYFLEDARNALIDDSGIALMRAYPYPGMKYLEAINAYETGNHSEAHNMYFLQMPVHQKESQEAHAR